MKKSDLLAFPLVALSLLLVSIHSYQLVFNQQTQLLADIRFWLPVILLIVFLPKVLAKLKANR